jgi:hypothetical protein
VTAPQRHPTALSGRFRIFLSFLLAVAVTVGVVVAGPTYVDVSVAVVVVFVVLKVIIGALRRHRLPPFRPPGAAPGWPGGVPVGWVALRLTGWSVRLLPVQDRPRYREEFESELFDLRKQSRWTQLRYGVRVLARSVALRRELRQSAPVMPVQEPEG